VAKKLGSAPTYGNDAVPGSILALAAASYGARPDEEMTQPTGFDPNAAALFEAVVEAAFLMAHADGHFDDTERQAFQQLVVTACSDRVGEPQIQSLIEDLDELLKEDGLDKRVEMVAKTVRRPEHAHEVLRIAALVARISHGVSDVERELLGKLASSLELGSDAVDTALSEVASVLED
jgi:tellurite resistance protein